MTGWGRDGEHGQRGRATSDPCGFDGLLTTAPPAPPPREKTESAMSPDRDVIGLHGPPGLLGVTLRCLQASDVSI